MHTQQNPLDGRTFGIGVLSVTACILFVGLILLLNSPPAHAIGMNDRGGDYILATQQVSNTLEALVVIDAAAKRMIVYAFDHNRRSLDIVEYVFLDNLPRPQERAVPQGGRRGH
jgi:hypothetical protein